MRLVAGADMTIPTPRPFVGMHMKCCNVYTRIYLTHDAKAYAGHCPRCAAAVRLNIVATGGMSGQFFEAGRDPYRR